MTNLPVYVFIKDQEGRYIFANEAYRCVGKKQITENDEKARRSSEPLETVEEVPYAKTRNSLRNTLEEKSALLKELQHRVKNSLVMIASLIGIEEKRSSAPQVRTLLRRLKERVYSIAELYTILNKTGGVRAIQLGDYLHREIENIKQAYFPENPNIIIAETLNSASVSVKDAAAYGLIVHELVTNAVKHAFPEGRSGTILIDLEKKKDGIEVKVSDDGIGLPSDFSIEKAGGSGMLLSKVLAEQLGGTFKFEQNDRTVFVLDVPLSG
jgi:two-component sensor histidine kinase